VARLNLHGEPLQLHIFVDRSSVELFAQGGTITMTNLVFPKPASAGISLATSGGSLNEVQLSMWKLRSIWKDSAE
jgi:sucrose-6-phosphate hydrolase SacC (GH32 family)